MRNETQLIVDSVRVLVGQVTDDKVRSRRSFGRFMLARSQRPRFKSRAKTSHVDDPNEGWGG